MTPRQIMAQFKATLIGIAAEASVGSIEREQQMAGALALANRLIRFHPQLSVKGTARPYLAELKALLATYLSQEEHVGDNAMVACRLLGHRHTA